MLYFVKICISIFFLIVFYIIALLFKKNTKKSMDNKDNTPDKILYNLLFEFIYYLIIIIGIIITLYNIGIDISSLYIILGSVSILFALTLHSILDKIIPGIKIIIFNYFNNNDFIQDGKKRKHIHDFNLFNTKILDNYDVETIIPNNLITNNFFINLSAQENIYADSNIKISSNNNIDYDNLLMKLKKALIDKCEYVIDKKKVFIYISDISSYGTEILMRFLIYNQNYNHAIYSSQLIARQVLNDHNILLLDNSYL